MTQVVLTGIATGGGVESTTRSAWDEGLNVTVVGDACLDPDQARHANTLERVIPGIGTVCIVDEVLEALRRR